MFCRQIVGVNQVVRILELIEHIGRSAVGSGVVVELLLEDKQVVEPAAMAMLQDQLWICKGSAGGLLLIYGDIYSTSGRCTF